MRTETQVQLDRELRRRRFWRVVLVLLAIGALATAFYFQRLDKPVETRVVTGVVQHVGPIDSHWALGYSRRGFDVRVKLADGRVVRILVPTIENPKIGDQVQVIDYVRGTGRHTFDWK